MTHKNCFVISPIGEEGSETRKHADDVFEYIIEPAMQECNINVFRSDHLDKPGKISDQMFRSIFDANLCIAVLTNHNPNVFYEVAVAQSAIRPVILMIEKGQKLPFDISDLRTVYYDLEIRSYKERTHIDKVINFVRQYEENQWVTEDLFKAYRSSDKVENDADFYETSGEYGTAGKWLELLKEADSHFDIMGTALLAWRKTKNFRNKILEKANAGCKVRIMLVHTENPHLDALSTDFEMQISNIEQNRIFYDNIAKESRNIEVRQIKHGLPHFFMTRNDSRAVVIQYLNSQQWGSGPLWSCTNSSKFYGVACKEFDELWKLNAGVTDIQKD